MATQRHQEIADLANTMTRTSRYTGDDVAVIMKAWQENYRQRKAQGRTKPSVRNAWRKAAAGQP